MLLIDTVPAIKAGPIAGSILVTGVTGGIAGSLINSSTEGHVMTAGGTVDRMTIEVGSMTLATLISRIRCDTIDICGGRTADSGTVCRTMTGITTVGRMNRTGERPVTGNCSGMTTDTVDGVRTAGGVDYNRTGMIVAVTVEVGGMTTLTVLTAGSTNRRTLKGASCSVMTGGTGRGVMDLTTTGIRYGGRSMTVQTKGYGTHRMLRSTRNTMLMIIEVAAMATLAVFTTYFTYRAARKGTVYCRVMAGSTTAAAMDIGTANEWSAGGCIMAVETETNGQSRMAVAMAVKISRMTGGTSPTTVIGKSGSVCVVHRRRHITIRRWRGYRIDQIIARVYMTAGAVVMDQVTGSCVYRHIVGTTLGPGMARQTRSNIRDQSRMVAGMTGSGVMTGSRTVTGRSSYRIGCIMMDRGLAVGSARMTIQTGTYPAGHQESITITTVTNLAGIVAASRINMTEGTGITMDPCHGAKSTIGMTVDTVFNYSAEIPVSSRMAPVVAKLVSMTGGTGQTSTGHDSIVH